MNASFISASLLVVLFITGCARREEAEPTNTPAPAPAMTEQQRQEVFEKTVPKATIAPVKVTVTLSPAAEAILKSKSEKILIDATYSGDPAASQQAQAQANEFGMVPLGENKRTLDAAGSVVFDDDVIDKSRTNLIVGQIQLTINVTSSKTSSPNNLLACPFYWKTLKEASADNIVIACKALSEVPQGD